MADGDLMRERRRSPQSMLAIAKVLRAALPSGRVIDVIYSTLRYIIGQRRIPRYRNPKLFNDHLYRLRNDGSLLSPLRQFVTDKEYVKHYIASLVGWQYTLKTIAVIRTESEIDDLTLNEFPCVIKPSHMSGEVIILGNRSELLDRAILKRWLRTDYYRVSREPNYRHLLPKIIVEEFFVEDGTAVPRDFKIHCFFGTPKLIQVDSGRFSCHTRNMYDESWRRVDLEWAYPKRQESDVKPRSLDVMLSVAGRLARSFSYIRVDMYTDGSTVKVGEMTSCPEGAKRPIVPSAAEAWIGDMLSQ